MTMTTFTQTGSQTTDCRVDAIANNHPIAFVLLLIDHGVRRRQERAARRQRRQFRQQRPRLMPIQ